MTCRRRQRKRGNVAVVTAMFLVVLLSILVLALDLGVSYVVQGELQRAADSAALAAAWELAKSAVEDSISTVTAAERAERARAEASRMAAENFVLGASPELLSADIEVGEYDDLENGGEFNTSSDTPNAVRVTVRRSLAINGAVPLLFGRALGREWLEQSSTATAAVATQARGFRVRTPGENLAILPFALDETSWDALMNGAGGDNYAFDPNSQSVEPGFDGRREVDLFPQGFGLSGHRGTLIIGGGDHQTADVARQIVYGISQTDLDHVGGSLELDSNGELDLDGDTGISAGVVEELTSIIGKPRIVPLFRSVVGPGNHYTIVRFVGVRVVYVRMTGPMSQKSVLVQPAEIVSRGVIPTSESSDPTSTFVTSPAWLIQ